MQHVGIDFSSGVELAQHTEALADPGAGSGAGSGAARTEPPADAEAGLPSSTDTAFFLYYDEVAEKYDMRDPLVVAPDGSEVECSKPSSLERGVRYFCVVTLKDGGYAADVLSESAAEGKDPGGYDALWKVHLFNVPKEGEEDYGDEEPGHEDGMQYHTGAVVVVGGGGGGGGVTPDGASTEFRSDGDGHDGELQLKDFHDFGASKDENTLADYLADGTKADDYQCLVRGKATGSHTQALGYVPLGQLTPPYKEGDNIEISDPDDDGKRTISAKVPEPDGVSTELVPHDSAQGADNSDEGRLQVKGFADAPVGTIPKVVDDNGVHKLGWGTIGDFALTATKSGSSWTYTIGDGYITRARLQEFISGTTVSTTGYVYLKVPLTSGSASIVVESSPKSSDSSYTYIRLYYCNVSGRVSDYRGAPHIQVWE